MRIIDFNLPSNLISKKPASPRDSSRLFVYDTKKDEIMFDKFRNIGKYLPSKSILVFNNTKVLPARLHLTKDSGGKVEVLLLINESDGDLIKAIADRQLTVGTALSYKQRKLFEVIKQDEQFFFLKPLFPKANLSKILMKIGETPLPPYMGRKPLKESDARKKYQTVFAKYAGSVAAPTASLHFTKNLISKLKKIGIKSSNVLLHVGMGTFSSIDESNFSKNKLHVEPYEVSKSSLQNILNAKKKGYSIIPVGTTSTRVLETIARDNYRNLKGNTDIFIFNKFKFQLTDSLITNFHTPKSSLVLLVDAYLKHKNAKRSVLDLYKIAIENNFKFYSFGDSMLII